MAKNNCEIHDTRNVVFVTRDFCKLLVKNEWNGRVVKVLGELFPGQDYVYFVNEKGQLILETDSQEEFSLYVLDQIVPYCEECFLTYMQEHEGIDDFDSIPTVKVD